MMSEQTNKQATQGEQGQTDSEQQNQPPQQQPAGGNDNETEIRAAKLGVLAFAVVGLGYFIMSTLVAFIGDEDASFFVTSPFQGAGEEELFVATAVAIDQLIIFAPLLAVGLAVYYYMDDIDEGTPKLAVIASAAGLVAIGFLLMLLAVVFEPSGADVSLGDQLPGFIAAVIGTVVVAGGAGYVFDEDPLEIL